MTTGYPCPCAGSSGWPHACRVTVPDADDTRIPAPGSSGVRPAAAPPRDGPGARSLRAVLVVAGTLSLAIGVIGIVIPVLPTTPFLLLAAACYARASDRLYAWLIGQPSLGPIITEWRSSRSLPPGVRTRALALVALSFGVSIVLADGLLLRAGLVVIALVVCAFLYRIPTRH
jgi:uncharacterized membrane protein YbaN (DUF454 family)